MGSGFKGKRICLKNKKWVQRMGSELRYRKWVRRKVSGLKGSKVGANDGKWVDRMGSSIDVKNVKSEKEVDARDRKWFLRVGKSPNEAKQA